MLQGSDIASRANLSAFNCAVFSHVAKRAVRPLLSEASLQILELPLFIESDRPVRTCFVLCRFGPIERAHRPETLAHAEPLAPGRVLSGDTSTSTLDGEGSE
jgi:hypothetical protein